MWLLFGIMSSAVASDSPRYQITTSPRMPIPFKPLFSRAEPRGRVEADAADSLLKTAFQKARAERNIDLVLPVFLASRLYVVTGGRHDAGDYFLTPSPTPDRLCVTVAERIETLRKIAWPKKETTGEELLRVLPSVMEIVILHPDGGDYLTREQLQWYRSQLA